LPAPHPAPTVKLVFNLHQHLEEVITPVLRIWNIFDRTDFTPRGEQVRDELAAFLDKLRKDVLKFEKQRDRALAREAQKRERQSV
jgi:acyl-[acyl-carrier-protein] desaturase